MPCVPGSAFYPDGSGKYIPPEFLNAQPDMIEIGIKRLGEALAEELEYTYEPEMSSLLRKTGQQSAFCLSAKS